MWGLLVDVVFNMIDVVFNFIDIVVILLMIGFFEKE